MSSWWDELLFPKFADVSRSVLHGAVLECYFFLFQPERIDPSASRQGYDVRSDVWSLGITLVSEQGSGPLLHGSSLLGVTRLAV